MADCDDILPRKARWMDMVLPYVRNEAIYHCPSVGAKQYGYEYNSQVAGKNAVKISDVRNTPLAFDSTILSRSAVANTATRPGRHAGKDNVVHVDTSAKAMPR